MNGLPTMLVFLKEPRPGQVKTRLAVTLGNERAAELYREWIGQTFAMLQPVRERARVIGYFDGRGAGAFAEWSNLADEWWPQPDGGLGERLQAGFDRAGGTAIAIGTDCPELDAGLVLTALDELKHHDAVFGPCPDGGYYLVGTARPLPGFFEAIRWSGPDTLADHLSRCRARNWSFTLLPERHDIDTQDDWHAYLARTHARRRDPDT